MRYACREDLTSMGVVLARRGDIVEPGQVLVADGVSLTLEESALRGSGMFEPVREGLSVSSRESDPSADDEARDWVIEIRVSTTRSRLIKIEDFIRSGVPGLL